MKNIFLSSDAHFSHRNIIKYCDRPFFYVEEMNERLIQNWNEVVRNDDEVYYLGDFGLHSPEVLMPFRNRLNGNWKMFIGGNHDRNSLLQSPGLAEQVVKFSEKKVVNFELDGIPLWLSHCPANVLPNDPINLYGHTHDHVPMLAGNNRKINIGVDAWNLYPVAWEQIKALL